jgi:predicted membrane channel-forming protein YqfA (hemolysin III family)
MMTMVWWVWRKVDHNLYTLLLASSHLEVSAICHDRRLAVLALVIEMLNK